MKKAYFVHIPKTAGNSVRACLRRKDLLANPGFEKAEREHHWGRPGEKRILNQHSSFNTSEWPCYLEDPNFKKSKFSFSVLRNPYDLLYSYYSHYVNIKPTKEKPDNGWANVNEYHRIYTFEQFIDVYTSIDPEDWHVPPLCKNLFGQLFDDDKKCVVDNVIFFEKLEQGLIHLLINLEVQEKMEINLPHRMKSNQRKINYIDAYNEDMINKVKKKCEWELDTFKYSFGSKVFHAIGNVKGLPEK